ncbi:MAG: hybrid sensor histidine kinase/response regulator [Acidobacteria bacterium]|nr:MAG: hybrid sensor histidine kinase/response regulator [Acidobacteriota bacterium]
MQSADPGKLMLETARILVIDDNRDDFLLIRLLLSKEAKTIRICHAGDQESLGEAIRKDPVNLVITERVLPWSDGFRIMEELRHSRVDCPMLMLTGRGSEEIASEAIKCGFADYLPKSSRGYARLPGTVAGLLDNEHNRPADETLVRSYETLVGSISEPAFIARRTGVILYANRPCLDFLGMNDGGGLRGRQLSEFLPDLSPTAVLGPAQPVRTHAKMIVRVGEKRIRKSAHLTACLVSPGGDLLFGTLAGTSEKLGSSSLAARVESESQAELQLVLVHDLHEPLRTVARCGRLLQETLQNPPDGVGGCLATLLEATERMSLLLDGYRHSVKAAAAPVVAEPVELDRALDKAITNLDACLRESGAIIRRCRLPAIRAVETEMVSLFQNLIENAVKFRGDEPPRIDIGAHRMPSEWLFSVKDNGIGVESDDVGRIFGMFRRGANAAERPGTGIGLAVCKQIVERSGGRMWLDSRPSSGSTFYFTLRPNEDEPPG